MTPTAQINAADLENVIEAIEATLSHEAPKNPYRRAALEEARRVLVQALEAAIEAK